MMVTMVLPAARAGSELAIRGRALDFTFFPMRRGNRRWGLSSMLYAADPWALIDGAVNDATGARADRESARSFVRQGREFFVAAESASAAESKPLLYYYCFLNLAKALGITRGIGSASDRVQHGISPVGGVGYSIANAHVDLRRSTAGSASAIDWLHRAISGGAISSGRIPVEQLTAQSVVAHRLWREVGKRRERFLSIASINLLYSPSARLVWASVQVPADTMRALGRGVNEVVRQGGLAPTFRAVAEPNRSLHTFEQVTPVTYSHRPSDVVTSVVEVIRPTLWRTITSARPYRRYYLYLSPDGEVRLPQMVSIYAIMFYLGSLARYQPLELLAILEGSYGAYIREFLATQPSQWLYSVTSEFKRQEVSRAAVV